MEEAGGRLNKRSYFSHYLWLLLITGGLLWFGLWPTQFIQAATLSVTPATGTYSVNQSFSVSVIVSSSDKAINAVSGNLSFSADQFEVTSISKSGSIISLWVEEPSFSNTSGSVRFEGIILNPGFTGASGKVVQVNFRAKAAGSAQVKFLTGSVLANDGKGTNVLTSLGSASYDISPAAVGPQSAESSSPAVEPAGVPLAPQVSSSTHPDPDKWYANNNPTFTWILPAGTLGVNVLADRNPTTNPGTRSDGMRSSYTFNDVDDGIWYFHIRLQNRNGWGAISHFRFQIDTVPPEDFVIVFPQGNKIDKPRPLVVFDTTDAESSIDYYKVQIGDNKLKVASSELVAENPYQLPPQEPGDHTILVQAFDKAGNYATATADFTILPIAAPVITNYPKELRSGDILTIKGTTNYAQGEVTVWLQPDGGQLQNQTVTADDDGKFTFVYREKLPENTYQVWATVQNLEGAQSSESAKVTIAVKVPPVLKFGKIALDYLTLLTTIILLIIGILVMGIYSWYRVAYWRKKIAQVSKTTRQAEKDLRQAFVKLREQVEEQISKLDGKVGLSRREKQINDKLKKVLKESEGLIEKEVSEIEKELE